MLSTLPRIKNMDSMNFFLIAGPCVVEDRETTLEIADAIYEVTNNLNIPFIFKSSYRKANRSRLDSFTGIGDIPALEILAEVGDRLEIPVLTDIHAADEAQLAADYVDVLQIPAFLCRQTDILEAAAQTGKYVNVKKGQFLSGEAMKHVVDKVKGFGNDNIVLTDRGNFFGYNDLVVDYRNIAAMKQLGVPVVLDITHSLQQPNQSEGVTGGQPELIETLGRAGVATGADGIFLETHPRPEKAKSDGANMLPLKELDQLLRRLKGIRKAVNLF